VVVEAPRCSVCGRRAVYKRSYSGELLCERCLLRSLARSVKRQASRSGGFRPRMRVLVPAALTAPHLGLALALALHEATRGLDVTVDIAVPAGREWEVYVHPDSLARLMKLPRARLWKALLRLRRLPSSLRACLRLDRAWSAAAARLIGAGAVGLPVTRTTVILVMLDSLMEGADWGLSDALEESVDINGVHVAPLLYSVEGEAAAALAAAWRLYAWSPCKPRSLSAEAFWSVAGRRPELEFSVQKVVGLLARGSSRARCPLCGGASPGGVCPDCRISGLEGVEVEEFKPSPGRPGGI